MPYLRILWEELEPLGFKASYQIVLPNRIITLESLDFPRLPTPIAEIGQYNNVYLYVPEKMGDKMIADGFGHMACHIVYLNFDEHLPLMKDFSYPLNDS